MNCLKFKNGFESSEDLEGEMLAHVDACVDCARLVEEERALTELLSELPKSEAPASFGQSVRTRIREGEATGTWFWPAARIAIPAAAMLLIVGFFVMNSDLFVDTSSGEQNAAVGEKPVANVPSSDTQATPEIAQTTDDDAVKDDSSVIEPAPREPLEKLKEPQKKSVIAGKQKSPVKKPNKSKGGSIDSFDQAFEEPETINPPGIEPEKKISVPKKPPQKVFTSAEILATLGLKTVRRNGALIVVSVAKNSAAQRAGVKPGDEIRSIDGNSVGQKPTSKGLVRGQVLGVVRSGEKITIKIGVN
jgi:membrane-associated protease RseP (regulator of RpoE activity)